jgi:hypothetical protein
MGLQKHVLPRRLGSSEKAKRSWSVYKRTVSSSRDVGIVVEAGWAVGRGTKAAGSFRRESTVGRDVEDLATAEIRRTCVTMASLLRGREASSPDVVNSVRQHSSRRVRVFGVVCASNTSSTQSVTLTAAVASSGVVVASTRLAKSVLLTRMKPSSACVARKGIVLTGTYDMCLAPLPLALLDLITTHQTTSQRRKGSGVMSCKCC